MLQRISPVLKFVIPFSEPCSLLCYEQMPVSNGGMFCRLCLLVQDAYGMFSEVQLQSLSSTDDSEQYCRRWEGKSCCLAGMKILQRTTRGRWEQLMEECIACCGRQRWSAFLFVCVTNILWDNWTWLCSIKCPHCHFWGIQLCLSQPFSKMTINKPICT